MAENYKHLYEQTKKMLAMYQDELVPGFRKQIEELEKNQVKVRCKDCKRWKYDARKLCGFCDALICYRPDYFWCMYGERRNDG